MQEDQTGEALRVLNAHGFEGGYACAMVLGTGLGKLADDLTDANELPYSVIPGFPKSGVSGHAGALIAGKFDGKQVLILKGRAHFYETGDPAIMRVPIATIAALGSPPLLLTNAAGSVKADIRPGNLVLIKDHINLSGTNPLIGEEGDKRFVSLTGAYDHVLAKRLKGAATNAGIALAEGVYMWFSGPSFETPAEIRMARMLGADIVGMSTAPEVILARRYGLSVAAISVITNMAAGIEDSSPSHRETREVATTAAAGLRRVIRGFITGLKHG